ncbi:MAG: DUF2306 domain-containing protein [Caldilinea sp. CFX5]|nr:DUF2306 domain-containing protein [Caldilinea sp. CFX5]
MRWFLPLLVGLLALIGIGASVGHYLMEPYNPGFREYATITAFHVILGGVYLALAPFQFVQRIRNRWLGYHRWVGRLLVAIGLVIGATALFMGIVFPTAGWPQSIVNTLFGVLFLAALVLGFVHVRAGRIAQHREWMIHAFAIGLAIATTRLISVPTIIAIGEPTEQQAALIVLGSFTASFLLHAGFAEWWIRRTRQHGNTATGATRAAWRSAQRSV